MKILTAAEMREVDRLTIELGIPGQILMENAGSRVVEFLLETFTPLSGEDVLVVCGKGNNGGDGFVIARQLFTRKLCCSLTVVELFDPKTLTGDALVSRKMLEACGCLVTQGIRTIRATVVIDAILGTGLRGPAEGKALEAIQKLNTDFPLSKVIAVDIPSGMSSDGQAAEGEFVRADYTVTFTAPKRIHVFAPGCGHVGELRIYPIGSPTSLLQTNPLNLSCAEDFRDLYGRRTRNSNKGMYGHVLVIGGSYGKSGAPAMTGLGAYRSGAGLVTVAVPPAALPVVAAFRPELMTVPLGELDALTELVEKMSVLAVGPGLGTEPETVRMVRALYEEEKKALICDADALNGLAGNLPHCGDKIRILTPHPGEMARLTGKSTKDVQSDRLAVAQEFAQESGAIVVLKGDQTVIAFPDGETWINPTGSPSMATGGTGDVLTGMIAGTLAQHPDKWKRAILAAVWLHGRCGELAANRLGEQCTLATDLLDDLPEAMDELRPV